MIYLHGNDANIATRMNILHYEQLAKLGLNVMAPEYRGFAGLQGVPTEAGLAADARAAYDYLRQQLRADPRRIVIYGWSLGSAVAVDLASHVEEAAVILEGRAGVASWPSGSAVSVLSDPSADSQSVRVDYLRSAGSDRRCSSCTAPKTRSSRSRKGAGCSTPRRQPKQCVEVAGGHVYASREGPAVLPFRPAFLQTHRLLP